MASEAKVPLRDTHFLDDVVVEQDGDHVRVRAGKMLVGGTVAGLAADIEALPVDDGQSAPNVRSLEVMLLRAVEEGQLVASNGVDAPGRADPRSK